jgi:hypothetical protein
VAEATSLASIRYPRKIAARGRRRRLDCRPSTKSLIKIKLAAAKTVLLVDDAKFFKVPVERPRLVTIGGSVKQLKCAVSSCASAPRIANPDATAPVISIEI